MDPRDFITLIALIGVVLGGLGYAAGVFLSSRRRGVSDALSTALDEVAAMRLRADRLAEEVANLRKKHDDELGQMRERLTMLESENRVLRETLQTGIKLAPEFQQVIVEQLRLHEERSETLVDDRLKAFAERTKRSHHLLSEALPPEIGGPLRRALEAE